MADSTDTPDPAALEEIATHVDATRYVSAWKIAQRYAPPRSWPRAEAGIIASRLVDGLGDGRLGSAIDLANERSDPENDEFFARAAFSRVSICGPLETLERVEQRLFDTKRDIAVSTRSKLLGLRGSLLGMLRDFENAHRSCDEAIELEPDRAWLHVQRSIVQEMEDRYDEALATARYALEMDPISLSAASQLIDCLTHCHRDDEAQSRLEDFHSGTEAGFFAPRLVNLHSENEDYELALRYLDEFVARSPLLDRDGIRWVNRRRADFLYMAGDYDGSLEHCDREKKGFHTITANNLRQDGALERSRKRLDVPFIRQHSMTCAPATLASLAAFWKLDFDHLEIADAICYDGTPWHKERAWAEENGFCAHEFRLTREILIALIDRGVPFTLTTEAITSAHLQACIGYDDRRGTILIRDPTRRHYGEMILQALIDDHPLQGPRCMLLLPHAEIGRLDGLEFPDSADFDNYHQFSVSLDCHDRDRALRALESMSADGALATWAAYRLAAYDANPRAEVEAIEALTKRFPDDAKLRYSLLNSIQKTHAPDRQLQLLESEVARADCDPVWYSEIGEFLLRDARHLDRASKFLSKAVRQRGRTARVYSGLANCRWKERRFEEATRYRRFASCQEEAWEPYAEAFADACRAVSRPEEGIAFLQSRIDRLGSKAGGPWITLATELDTQYRTSDAKAVIEDAIAARPDDGDLMLSAGRLLSSWGEIQRGSDLLDAARGKVRESAWLRQAAQFAAFLGRREEAIVHWQAVVELEPSAIDAHRSLAQLLAEEKGNRKAIDFLRDATERQPRIPALWSLRAQWEEELGPQAAIGVLEDLLVLDPGSAWGLRELASQRLVNDEPKLALQAAEEAAGKDPNSASSHGTLGRAHEALSENEKARDAYEQAIRLDIDYVYASNRLLLLARDRSETVKMLGFIEAEMRAQVSDGTIVLEYRDLAFPYLEPEVLHQQLCEFCEERPDLWQTWSARRLQALDMDRIDEAFECARALTDRFPALPRSWMELAGVHHAARDFEAEAETLAKAVALSPAWDEAARRLADCLERMERYDEAIEVLERASYHSPLAPQNGGCLADLLWKRDRRTEAFDRLLATVEEAPGYGWGWRTLTTWGRELDRKDEVMEALRSHEDTRGHLSGWWTSVADTLRDLGLAEEALATVDEGLAKLPHDVDLIDHKAFLLCNAGDHEAALTVCAEGIAAHPDAHTLQGRLAWVTMASGKPVEAIRRMTELAEQHPDYLWATSQLCSWLGSRGRWKELRELSRKWIRQEPQSALAHGYLGQASMELEDRKAAKTALTRAFALDPCYAYAGRNILTYQIKDGELEAAAATLRTLEHHCASPEVKADGIELALAQAEIDSALDRARQLLQQDDTPVNLLTWAADQFTEHKQKRAWHALLDIHVTEAEGELSAAAARTWVQSLVARNRVRDAVKYFDKICDEHPAPAEAGWLALLETLTSTDQRSTAWKWIEARESWFRSSDKLWAAAGGALADVAAYDRACEWLGDWKHRSEEVGSGPLFNYAIAAEEMKGWQAGTEAREAALLRKPSERLSQALRVTAAFQRAANGQIDEARALCSEIEHDMLTSYYAAYHQLTASMVAAADGKENAAKTDYQNALSTFNGWTPSPGGRSLFESASEVIASHLPWAKGKPARVRRRWGNYTGAGGSGAGTNWWIWAIVIYLLIKLLTSLSGG